MKRSFRGQSLIEVTVALSILSIVMMGVLTLGLNIIGYSVRNKARTQAIALAQEGLEDLRSQGGCWITTELYKQSQPGGDPNPTNDAGVIESKSGQLTGAFINFHREVWAGTASANQVPSSVDASKFWSATVTVSWSLYGAPVGENLHVTGLIKKGE